MFEGRRSLIATKHYKEKLITPILEKGLGVRCFVLENYDSDIFGTFYGEVARKTSSWETVRVKCIAAMQKFNCDIRYCQRRLFWFVSQRFFAQSDDEFLIFIDKKLN